MRIARMLADEGAVLRHSEIMELWVAAIRGPASRGRVSQSYQHRRSRCRGTFDRANRQPAAKFLAVGDKDGLRLLREEVLEAKAALQKASRDKQQDVQTRQTSAEIAEWLTIWLQSPELYENWIKLRRSSADFKLRFPGRA